MKLFLSSQAITKQQAPHLTKLVGKLAKDTRLAVIENAADVEAGPKTWLLRNRAMIESHGFDVEYIDLKTYRNNVALLHKNLEQKDVIWFGGGNIFYLRWLLSSMGIEDMLRGLMHKGKVYGGGSAGSIVAGPTLRYFEAADDTREAPEILFDGLGLTNKVVLPHMDSTKYAPIMNGIHARLKSNGYQAVPLTDAQALVINGNSETVI